MADRNNVIATDSIHVTAVSSEPLQAGTAFTVKSEEDAKRLEGYGHERGSASVAKPTRKNAAKR